jgi:Tfp pilus assembly protein PilN
MRAVNLIPSDQRSGGSVGAGRSGGVAYVVLGVVAAVAVLALMYGIAKHDISSRKGEVASSEARATAAQSAAAQLAPYAQFISMRQARMQAVESLVDSRFDWAHAFHELGRVLPRNVSITSLTGTIGPVAPATGGASSTPAAAAAAAAAVSSATPPGSIPTFALTGCAAGQDTVAQAMNRLRLINGVESVVLVSSSKAGASAGGASSSAGCGNAAAYTLNVSFQALPTTTAAAAAASTQTVAASPASGASGSGSTSSTSSKATGSTTAPATGAPR